jgi:hypothetical protein
LAIQLIEQVITALSDAGFRARRAFPGTAMPNITQVVTTVQLAAFDANKKETVLEVKLICPQSLGAQAVEDAAVTAAGILKDMGLGCAVGTAEFDGRAGIFSVGCQVRKLAEEQSYLAVPFKIGAVEQFRVVSFTAQQIFDETLVPEGQQLWKVRLEQFFLNGTTEDSDPSGDQFTITNNKEIYHGCEWTSRSRVTERNGTRQIREGTAMYRTVLA